LRQILFLNRRGVVGTPESEVDCADPTIETAAHFFLATASRSWQIDAASGEATFERKTERIAKLKDVMRAIIHVDMDAFYASVEQRDNPALQGKPLIVGGHAQRGVVLAASYEVRPFGVRSAMPMARALKLAPHAVVVRPRFSAYSEASEQVFAIFERYSPLVEPLSLDEAFLDVTASVGLFGTPAEIAQRIRNDIAAVWRVATDRQESEVVAALGDDADELLGLLTPWSTAAVAWASHQFG